MSLENQTRVDTSSDDDGLMHITKVRDAIQDADNLIQALDKTKWRQESTNALRLIQRFTGQVLIANDKGCAAYREDILENAGFILCQYESQELRIAMETILHVFDLTIADVDAILERRDVNGEIHQISQLGFRLLPAKISRNIRNQLQQRFDKSTLD